MEEQTIEIDGHAWEFAWCYDCGLVELNAVVSIVTDDEINVLTHIDDGIEGDICGSRVVEAAWIGTAAGGAVLIDVETGEVLDARRDPNDRQPFRVTDRDSAEWVLRHIFEAETEADAKRRRLQVLIENAEAEIKRHDREAQWFRDRFGAELQEWARQEIEGGRTRSVQTAWGRVGFRRKKGRTIIHDHETAAVSILGEDHEAVRTTHKVLVSQLSDDDIEVLRGTIGPDGEPSLVTVEEPHDAFYVDTGAGK